MRASSKATKPQKIWRALFVLMLTSALLLVGLSESIVDAYGRLGDTNTLAQVSLAVTGVPEKALPVTLLDIDDRTRDAWRARPKVPHAALAKLITIAANSKAALILLDFDLSGDIIDEKPDGTLGAVLTDYPSDAPPLLLARRIVFAVDPSGKVEPTSSISTPYDNLVSGKSNIIWITTLNDIDRDRSVRRVRLWQSICTESVTITYPAAALVAGAVFLSPRGKQIPLESLLADRTAADCRSANPPAPPWPGAHARAATVPFIAPDRSDARPMFFRAPTGENVQLLRRISAGTIVTAGAAGVKATGDIDPHPFVDRVVLIGASDAGNGDFYNTPFGTMSGVMVIANSVMQTNRILNARPMPTWLRSTTILLAFLSFVAISRRFQGSFATLLISLLSFLLLLIVARLFSLTDGVAVIAATVTCMALAKLLESFLNLALDVPTRGWRAILKR
jgi:CHASE2 domain-containing sensor protein